MRRSSHLMVLPVQVTFTDELGKSKVLWTLINKIKIILTIKPKFKVEKIWAR
jgi:hypothetical protein